MKKNNKTKFAILGLLTIEPLSGYDIKKMIEKTLSYFWSESNGQLYPALRQMTKSKWVSLKKLREKGKKASNRYTITDVGLSELKKWLRSEEDKSIYRDENLLKLFFGKNMSQNECIQRLVKRRQKMKDLLEEFHQLLHQLEKRNDSPHQLYWLLTLHNGIHSAKAEILWCSQSIKILREYQHEAP
jgi:DNA-binding PadR family transcriptional regulator